MREVAPFVRAEVDQALALNPSDPRPRFLLGAIALTHDYDWKAAETHFAASMNVPDVSGHARWIYASFYLRGLGRFEESADEMGRAVQLDPLNATWHAIWGAHHFDAGRFDQAIEEGLRATELEPNYVIAQHLLGEACWYSGKRSQAIAAFERAYQIAPWTIAAGWLAAALWLRDEQARARQIIEAMGESPEPLRGRVVYHLLTSDLDAAADWYGRTPRSVCPGGRESVRCRTLARASSLARARCAYEAASHGNMTRGTSRRGQQPVRKSSRTSSPLISPPFRSFARHG